MSERERSGWKLGSPPLLVHPDAPASMSVGDSTRTSSGSGGAPGSPGLGRLEEVVEDATPMLTPAPEDKFLPFWKDARLSEPMTSEVEGLCSPSGWKSMVEPVENILERSLVVLGGLMVLSDEKLKVLAGGNERGGYAIRVINAHVSFQQNHKPLRDSNFSFLAFCTSSVILAMMKFCERISRMESIKASRPRGFSARMSSSTAVLLVWVLRQLISSASSRVRILRERRKSRWRSALILSQR